MIANQSTESSINIIHIIHKIARLEREQNMLSIYINSNDLYITYF